MSNNNQNPNANPNAQANNQQATGGAQTGLIRRAIKSMPGNPWAASEASNAYDGPFSYKDESHAFEYGAGLAFLTVVSLLVETVPVLGTNPTPLLLGALVALGLSAVRGRRGEEKMVKKALNLAGQQGVNVGHDVPAKLAEQIGDEPHYYLAGAVAGAVLGAAVVVIGGDPAALTNLV